MLTVRFGPELQQRFLPLVLEREAENNLVLGLLDRITGGHSAGGWIATIMDGTTPLGCAVQTPPRSLALTRLSVPAIDALVEAMSERKLHIPGVNGPRQTVEAFAERWCKCRSVTQCVDMSQGIYQLDTVIPPGRAIPGRMREVRPEDAPLLAQWFDGFLADTGVHANIGSQAVIERWLAQRSLSIWEVGDEPVAQAAWTGPTPNGIRINAVYTPPDRRGRGYASALVAQLSQHLLDQGRRFCFLYTDLSNPISNRIYQRIGYRRVSDAVMMRFTAPDEASATRPT